MKLAEYIRDFIGRIQFGIELKNTYKRLENKDRRLKKVSEQVALSYFKDCVLRNKGYFRLRYGFRRYNTDKEIWDIPEYDEVSGYVLMTYGTLLIMGCAKVPDEEILDEVLEENYLMIMSKDISRTKVTYYVQPETMYVSLEK